VLGPEGAPVPGATVEIHGEPWRGDVTTDASGCWRFDAVGASTYRIVVSAKTYAAYTMILEHDGTTDRTGVVLNVVRGAKFTGKVVDVNGVAVARPLVSTLNAEEEHPQQETVRGDERGCFEMLLAPSTYTVFAHEGHRASAGDPSFLSMARRLRSQHLPRQSQLPTSAFASFTKDEPTLRASVAQGLTVIRFAQHC
jgi:hypothetical protein